MALLRLVGKQAVRTGPEGTGYSCQWLSPRAEAIRRTAVWDRFLVDRYVQRLKKRGLMFTALSVSLAGLIRGLRTKTRLSKQ